MQPEQSFAKHTRFHPLYHWFLVPILGIDVIVRAVQLARFPSLGTAWDLLVAIALISLAYVVRIYSLRVQDRVIRVEETLRLERLLAPELRPRIAELSGRQLIALRFCPDEQLPELAAATLAGECREPREIKQRIRGWRPDYRRI